MSWLSDWLFRRRYRKWSAGVGLYYNPKAVLKHLARMLRKIDSSDEAKNQHIEWAETD